MAETKTPSKTIDKEREDVTPSGDGTVTNTPGGVGTIQSEPTPEELPSDAKIAPLAEQLRPNGAAQAVGAIESEEEKGRKTLQSDMSDATKLIPADSAQQGKAKRVNEAAKLRAEG